MTLRAYRRKDGSVADLRPAQDLAYALLYAELADADRRVATAILYAQCQFGEDDRRKPVSIGELMELGLARRTVFDALRRLLDANVIQHERHGGGLGQTAAYAIEADITKWRAGERVRAAAPFLFDGCGESDPGESAGHRTKRVRAAAPKRDAERVRAAAPHIRQAIREATFQAGKGAAQAPPPPFNPPLASGTTSDVVPSEERRIEDIWKPPEVWPPRKRARATRPEDTEDRRASGR